MSTTLFYMELGREGHFKEQEHKPTGCLYLSKFPPPSPPPPKKGLIFKSIGKKDCYLNSHTHNCRFIYQSGLFELQIKPNSYWLGGGGGELISSQT